VTANEHIAEGKVAIESGVAASVPAGSVAIGGEETLSISRQLHWILRIGAAMCFIGHGAFGIITKAAWVPYFGVIGIPERYAYALMPVVGMMDIAAGLALLLVPVPGVLVYMSVWGLWTALLRPLSGDNIWETLERAGNYGVPFAFFLLAGGRQVLRDWLAPVVPRAIPGTALQHVTLALRWTTALLLAGHGALGSFVQKPLLAEHYAAIGLGPEVVPVIGTIEIATAVAVLTRPSVLLLLIVSAWKLASESLFLLAGAPVWEFVERGGSYAAPLALALLLFYQNRGRSAARGVT
jgi:hypothetical protein